MIVRVFAGFLALMTFVNAPLLIWAGWPIRSPLMWMSLLSQPVLGWAFFLYARGGMKELG